MSETISWHVELAVKPGQLDAFRALTGEMVAFTRTESGVRSYQRFVSGDGTRVHVYESYEDSAAALAHLKNFAVRFGSRFLTMVERRSFTVFGRPSAELRQVLDGLGATCAAPFGDFAYWG
jgi:quinol monooxygenase YgiN